MAAKTASFVSATIILAALGLVSGDCDNDYTGAASLVKALALDL